METLAIIYILAGSTTIGIMHLRKYREEYREKLPVIFRLHSLKRWLIETKEF